MSESNATIAPHQGKYPEIGQEVYIHPTAVIIGQVKLCDQVSIWPGVVVRGDVNRIHVDEGSNVQDGSILHVSHKSSWDPGGSVLTIGRHVTIGHRVILHGCSIGDECLIGMGSIVMDKATIQQHVLLAAGSLVPEGKLLESGFLYMGSPARKIRPLTELEIAHFMYSANHYMHLKNQYLYAV